MRSSKRRTHRRGASGSFLEFQKQNPVHELKYTSEPENYQKKKLVDTMTQTDAMEISEISDASPNALSAYRTLMNTLESHKTDELKPRLPTPITQQPQSTVSSPSNNNTNSDITFQDACSSPDQLVIDDAINSNERLDMIKHTQSDDEHLERLERQVSDFVNETIENGNTPSMSKKRVLLCMNENSNQATILRNRNEYINVNSESRDGDSWSDDDIEQKKYFYKRKRYVCY